MRNQEKPSQETKDKWHKAPNNWIWGMFYYNKEDKRLMPPKRVTLMGWTVNFANRNSVLLFVTVIIAIIILIYFLPNHKK
ncbi:DUF5808 domain-containing protein [uncultured Flavobacterium sp.]|uniref:DUF5808 domain-containing protein n=1 Tax=uncultured Flavobacterium sp. TaxID=165435 RepID=UPI0030CA30F8